MNKNKQIIGFADQTFCDKNAPPKILSKRNRKNEMTIPAKRIHQTAMGFQAINGESYICFPENSRSHNMMLFVAEIRKRNLSNKDENLLTEKINKYGKTKGYKKTFTKSVKKLIFKEHKDDEFIIDALIRKELRIL